MRTRGRPPLRLVVNQPVEERADFTKLVELASDPDQAAKSLPPAEREAYLDAQRSVVDARRSAEVHEGLLQVN